MADPDTDQPRAPEPPTGTPIPVLDEASLYLEQWRRRFTPDTAQPRVLSFATASIDGALPPNAVWIGHASPEHGLAASKWDTPYRPETHGTAEDETGRWDECVFMHRVWLPLRPDLMAAVGELRGKDLVCWYAEEGRSHGDVLLEMANR